MTESENKIIPTQGTYLVMKVPLSGKNSLYQNKRFLETLKPLYTFDWGGSFWGRVFQRIFGRGIPKEDLKRGVTEKGGVFWDFIFAGDFEFSSGKVLEEDDLYQTCQSFPWEEGFWGEFN